MRQRVSAWLIGKLHRYLLELQRQVLRKSASGAAVRYALNQWEALTRLLDERELRLTTAPRERANRGIAMGSGNWTFSGRDTADKTAAVLRSFIASCKRCDVERFLVPRIPSHSIPPPR